VSVSIIWFFSGLLISSVERIAKRFQRADFSAAFFLLGLLTSISEISVAVNAGLEGVPQVSVGNLIGASLVILLLLVPVLAILNKGIALRKTLASRNLLLTLVTVLLPVLFATDGAISRAEGILSIVAYIALLFAVKNQKDSLRKEVRIIEADISSDHASLWWDGIKIGAGAVCIFIAGHFLVEQAVYVADMLGVARSLIGLGLLSITTNIPELTIAVRAVLKKHSDIAFGDYLGSAAANTAVFGGLAMASGGFLVEKNEFIVTGFLMTIGFALFYVFARSNRTISAREAMVLVGLYGICFCAQIYFLTGGV
jgi:cation:H+ antiporter